MRSIFITMVFVLSATLVAGQSGTNPFDIVERLDSIYVDEMPSGENVFDIVRDDSTPQTTTEQTPRQKDTLTQQSVSSSSESSAPDEKILNSNPFEVSHIPVRRSKLKQDADAFARQSPISIKDGTQAPSSNTFIFWLSLLAGVLLAVVINIRRNTIVRIAKSLLNENILKYNHREEKQGLSGYYLMLYSVFFITASIFTYLLVIRVGVPTGFQTFSKCFAAILGAYLLKHMVLKGIGLAYPLHKECSLYGFTIETFNIFVGLLLLPLNLIIAFGPVEFSQIFLYLSLASLGILLIVRSFRGALIATSYIQNHIFHFFLYLCAVEIVPVLVLLKTLS